MLQYVCQQVLLCTYWNLGWVCKVPSVCVSSPQKIGHKRVMLFTDNDDPHSDSITLQVSCVLWWICSDVCTTMLLLWTATSKDEGQGNEFHSHMCTLQFVWSCIDTVPILCDFRLAFGVHVGQGHSQIVVSTRQHTVWELWRRDRINLLNTMQPRLSWHCSSFPPPPPPKKIVYEICGLDCIFVKAKAAYCCYM